MGRSLHTFSPVHTVPLGRLGVLAPVILAAGLGCKVGPRFKPEPAPEVKTYGRAPLPAATEGDAQRFLQGQDVPSAWWNAFGCAELDRRVERALAHSPTIASAQAAVRVALENARAAAGGRLPSLDAQAGIDRQKFPPVYGITTPFTIYSATLSVSYTLDLFGGVRSGIEGLQAQADVRQWILRGTYLSLAANVTTATIQEASLREQLKAAQAVVDLLAEQEALTRRQEDIGVKSQGDLLAIQAQLAAARAALPPLAQQMDAVRSQLSVYLGAFPSSPGMEDVAFDGLKLPPELPVSLPSKVVERRPDIQAAQAQVHAATAQAGVAAAALLPQITLGGAYGPQALGFRDMFNSTNAAWNAALGITQPIFHGGALRAQKRASQAAMDQALADYRQTVLVAFANVSDALSAVQYDAQALAAQTESEDAASRSLELVKAQYRIGTASYLQLLDATRTWQQARLGLIRARAARLSDTTALYAAMGGGI